MRAVLALLVVSAVACSSSEETSCTELACDNGVRVDFTYRLAGEYVFEVTIDGQLTTCRATLPLADPPPQPCDHDGVFLGLSGSKLPASQQSIEGLTIPSTTIKHLTVRVQHNGALAGQLDRAVDYQTSPGPNGPSCEPKECRTARYSL